MPFQDENGNVSWGYKLSLWHLVLWCAACRLCRMEMTCIAPLLFALWRDVNMPQRKKQHHRWTDVHPVPQLVRNKTLRGEYYISHDLMKKLCHTHWLYKGHTPPKWNFRIGILECPYQLIFSFERYMLNSCHQGHITVNAWVPRVTKVYFPTWVHTCWPQP